MKGELPRTRFNVQEVAEAFERQDRKLKDVLVNERLKNNEPHAQTFEMAPKLEIRIQHELG